VLDNNVGIGSRGSVVDLGARTSGLRVMQVNVETDVPRGQATPSPMQARGRRTAIVNV